MGAPSMKACGDCGLQYDHRVDFCFHDGAILVLPGASEPAPVVDPGLVDVDLPSLLPSPDLANRPPDDGPPPSQRIGGVAAEVPAAPPTDRSSLLMAGAVLAFVTLLVPVVGGGLLTYSMVVTSEWAPSPPHAEP